MRFTHSIKYTIKKPINFFYIKCIKIDFFCVFLLLLKLVFSFFKKKPVLPDYALIMLKY